MKCILSLSSFRETLNGQQVRRRGTNLYARGDQVSCFRTGGYTPVIDMDGVIELQIAPYHNI